ncbi:LytR C-terminal domain-containing protein [Streptomyces sp. BI20]|uniref:LytR C-terminal domain-containing protein n=1 Tax=Streptomyces sp. BI20 TaxID=3403460 RepID=UPI003C779B48
MTERDARRGAHRPRSGAPEPAPPPGPQAPPPEGRPFVPAPTSPPYEQPYGGLPYEYGPPQPPTPHPATAGPGIPRQAAAEPAPEAPRYHPEQFAFVEQADTDAGSGDVIDWLRFTESRTERREEARRRLRARARLLTGVLALALLAGTGGLWAAGLPPFAPAADAPAADAGPQRRHTLVVHLHDTKRGGTATALLVDNVTARRATCLLLPNSLAVPGDRGDGQATGLGASVAEDGLGGTRESLDTLLGTRLDATWRLDTPYLETLVDRLGGITLDTDTAVPADPALGTPAVPRGPARALTGAMAAAYATARGPEEPEEAALRRFGAVLAAVLAETPTDPAAAGRLVTALGRIPDPALTDTALAGTLAALAAHADRGAYATALLPVGAGGALAADTGPTLVRELLGGAARDPGGAVTVPRIGLVDATGASGPGYAAARAALRNSGWTLVEAAAPARAAARTRIDYPDAARRARALEVAALLGLPDSAVAPAPRPADTTVNTDVSVLLGRDAGSATTPPVTP